MRPWSPDGFVFALAFAVALVFTLAVAVAPAGAQFGEYTPPGGPGEPAGTPQEVLEEEMADAPWHWGPLRVAPWLGVRQAGYVNNVFAASEGEEVSDFTATAGAGLTAYLPTGPKTTWVFQAAPEYIGWLDLEERRQLAGRYGAGVFGSYNRLKLEATAGRREEQRLVTSEIPQPAVSRQDRTGLSLELRLAGSLWAFASGTLSELTDRSEGTDDSRSADFSRTDREERIGRAGLSWVRGNGLRVAVGAERSEVEFAPGARNLDNRGTAPILEVEMPGESLAFGLGLAWRSLEPARGSVFVPFDEVTGDLHVTWRPGWRFTFQPYARRALVFSLSEDYSHFLDQRLGVAVWFPLAERLTARFYAETGENDYQELRPGVPARTDDVTAWGADLTFELARALSLLTGFEQLDVDSNLPGLSRQVDSFKLTLGLTLGGSLLWE